MIGIIGDTHGQWAHLRDCWETLAAAGCTTAISVGDFGMWPHCWPPKAGYHMETLIIDGNHEHFWWMNQRGWFKSDKPVKIAKGCLYVPRGTVLQVDNRNILFMGGAESIDRMNRITGADWFPEESITSREFERALTACEGLEIDTVISHDCPTSFIATSEFPAQMEENSTRAALDALLAEVSPSYWYFGHHHISCKGKVLGCKWECVPKNECVVAYEVD